MDRRAFMVIATGLLAAPLGVEAQPVPKTARIGILSQFSGELVNPAPGAIQDTRNVPMRTFRQALLDLGYREGQTLDIEWRFAEGQTVRLPELAAELVTRGVDLILAVGTSAVLAAKQATTTIPIVMPFSGDPVGTGLTTSLERPGGNVTGLTNLGPDASDRRVALLRDTVPGARIAFIWNAANPGIQGSMAATRVAADRLGVSLVVIDAAEPPAFARAFDTALAQGAQAVIVYYQPLNTALVKQIVELTIERKLPTMYEVGSYAESGGLMAYGPNFPDLFRRSAGYVDRILRGAKPADLAIGVPSQYDFVINPKTASAIGLTIPPEVLSLATEVIR